MNMKEFYKNHPSIKGNLANEIKHKIYKKDKIIGTKTIKIRLGMDNECGGLHLWITEKEHDKFNKKRNKEEIKITNTISVHLNRKQCIKLMDELNYRLLN